MVHAVQDIIVSNMNGWMVQLLRSGFMFICFSWSDNNSVKKLASEIT